MLSFGIFTCPPWPISKVMMKIMHIYSVHMLISETQACCIYHLSAYTLLFFILIFKWNSTSLLNDSQIVDVTNIMFNDKTWYNSMKKYSAYYHSGPPVSPTSPARMISSPTPNTCKPIHSSVDQSARAVPSDWSFANSSYARSPVRPPIYWSIHRSNDSQIVRRYTNKPYPSSSPPVHLPIINASTGLSTQHYYILMCET